MKDYMNIKRFSKTKMIVFIIILFLLILEMSFDIFEITIGTGMQILNPIRPKVGRLWIEEKKDLNGIETTMSFENDSLISSTPIQNYHDLDDIQNVLWQQNEVVLHKNDFFRIYRTAPPELSALLINPTLLYDLLRNIHWQTVRIVEQQSQLALYFLDGSGQILHDEYIDSKQLMPDQIEGTQKSSIDMDPRFVDRIIDAELFWNAFDRLSKIYRLQIMNDPMKVIQWYPNLKRIAISKYVEQGGVTLAFEIQTGNVIRVYEVQCSEISVGYLIQFINSTKQIKIMSLPSFKSIENE